MRRIESLLMIYSIIVSVVCLYLVFCLMWPVTKQTQTPAVKAEPSTATTADYTKDQYHLGIRDGHVVILKESEIFETTNIMEDSMSEELRKKVEDGLSFGSAQEVYSFLESYTS